MGLIKTVSFSRISTYRWCPAQLRFSAVMGLKQKSTVAMDVGNKDHASLEKFVAAKGRVAARLPTHLAHCKPELLKVRDQKPVVEAQFAYAAGWQPVDWWAPTVLWRMKIDLKTTPAPGVVRLTDYKTGKIKPDKDAEQLELYLLTELLNAKRKPKSLETALWYTSHEEAPRTVSVYTAPFDKLARSLKRKWDAEAARVTGDKKLSPTPEPFKCSYCDYSSKRGGPCKAAKA